MPTELEDPRTYFAAERTFLAWIRTGLGLMGVGFALARFGLFLREFQASQQTMPHRSGLSVDSGIVLVALGIVVNVSAVVGISARSGRCKAARGIRGSRATP
jgi:putative membrane protein